ncbi:MAG: nucleotidyltransferase family protein, partial [Spongiibacteraceae bacterium]
AYSIADAFAYMLNRHGASSCLVLPVDLPLLRVSSIKAVAAAAEDDRIIVPECDGQRGHPVCFGRQFWPSLAALEGSGGARSVIDASGPLVTKVSVDDEGIYQDADTPGRMQDLLHRLKRDHGLY